MNKEEDMFNNLIFLDTETTGLEKEDKLFQLAYIYNEKIINTLFNPERKISIEASETTGYTNKDTDNKEIFKKSKDYKDLKKILENEKSIFIAHNAKFDIEMLSKEGLEVGKFIDTLKIARFLDDKSFFKVYRLQYLRYAMELDVKEAKAHDALGDILVLKKLFERLYLKMKKDFKNHQDILDKMIEISNTPSLIKIFNFGKYKDSKIEDIAKTDISYLKWLYDQKKQQEKKEGVVDEDWIYTLEKYLK